MTETLTLTLALERAARQLAATVSEPQLEAELLLAHVLGKDRAWLRAWGERWLDEASQQRFETLLTRRCRGEPIAYLLGRREFWSLPLQVTPATLIPRPETERLVELALARIPHQARWTIADLGTGSGAIALAVASERPQCRLLASDRCARALAVAQHNARALGIGNVTFMAGEWCAALADHSCDMILSNPPYIPQHDPHLAQGDLCFEPASALASGKDGLQDIRKLAEQARRCLKPGGQLLLEHGYDQGAAVVALLEQFGYAEVADYNDYAGHGRVACALFG